MSLPTLTCVLHFGGAAARCHTPIASSAARGRIVSHLLTLPHCTAHSQLLNKRRSTIALCCLPPVPTSNGYALRTHQHVERMCEALGVDETQLLQNEVTVSGRQTLLAMEGQWSLKWRNDRIWECFDGVEMTIEWGCDGKSEPWAVDSAGRCSMLELDDREVFLLSSWIRTGFWLTREGQKHLHLSVLRDGVAGMDTSSSDEFILSVQFRDGKVVAYVVVDDTTMYPLRASIKAFGGWSKWQFSDWKPLVAGKQHLFPYTSIHTQGSGNKEVYSVQECSVKCNNDGDLSYSSPTLPIVSRPQKNHPRMGIDPTCSPSVQMLRAESGHYLVQPLVNGKTIGYFIVDTGASTLIIAPHKARELGLTTFGEVYITGVNGMVKSQYSRANTFQLGQVRISNPVFMEIPVSGLVGGDPFVVGMCGFDIFSHCIVEMAHEEGRLSLFDPATYSESLQWHTLRFLESVPHVMATFNSQTALFMLDTGAGGVDIIFHGRAVKKFNMLEFVNSESHAHLMGINASSEGLEVTVGALDKFTVGGKSFKQVKAMLVKEENGGNLDTSEYVAGLLCGDLFSKCRVVFDYTQRRFAIRGDQSFSSFKFNCHQSTWFT